MSLMVLTLSNGRGQIKLNPGVIASIRPRTTGQGSLIICVGGAVHCVEDDLGLRQ